MKLNLKDTIKFGILVGFAAIFTDAAIAHGLWWENDPYWTYWISKTFLIVTVFTIGTALGGIGIKQGLIINIFHTLALEAYYQWFAPIGLPQEPWWLEERDLWLPGYFVHYLVILAGYLIALWIWLRSQVKRQQKNTDTFPSVLWTLAAAVLVIAADGVITQGILLQNFPGITFLVQHLFIAFVFLTVWGAFVGFDTKGVFGAALLLSLTWITFSMYLGPVGLPFEAPRYLSYNDLWLKSFPGAFVSILIVLGLLSQVMPLSMKLKSIILAMLILSLFVPQMLFAADSNPVGGGMAAFTRTSGRGKIITGPKPYNLNSTADMDGLITISAVDIGNRWSHVQNIDEMKVEATINAGDSTYKVVIDRPMPRHPLGKYATWMGVALNHSMHGSTGIGSDQIPKVQPEIALWGYASVEKDGTVIAKMAPAHVMVMTKEPVKGIALEVDAEDKNLLNVPDGYLHVMWPNIDSITMPVKERENRELIGWTFLLAVNGVFLIFAAQEQNKISTRKD